MYLVKQQELNLFPLYGFKSGLISSLLAGHQSFSDICCPLDLTGGDQYLNKEGYTLSFVHIHFFYPMTWTE